MKNKLYYFSQTLLVLVLLYWVYMASEEVDFFPWAAVHPGEGSLYPIAIVFFIFPIMLICFLLKYWALRKMQGMVFFRLTPLLGILGMIFLAIVTALVNMAFGGMNVDGDLNVMFLGLAQAIFFTIETILFAKGKKPWAELTSW